MQTFTETDTRRLDYLDSVRGLASLSVLIGHYMNGILIPTSVQTWTSFPPLAALWDGGAAVSLFFVLSGFVLSLKYFKQFLKSSHLQLRYTSYFITRVFRIWVPYVFVVLLSYSCKRFLFPMGASLPERSEWLNLFWRNTTHFKHLILETNLFVQPSLTTLVPQAWSLYTEMTISILVPAAVYLAIKSRKGLTFLTILLVWSLGAPVYLFHFLAGILMAWSFVVARTHVVGNKLTFRLGVLVCSLLMFECNTLYYWGRKAETVTAPVWISLITGLGAAGVILSVLKSPSLQSILSHSLLRVLGRISYSLYLCHFAILICFTPWIMESAGALGSVTAWAVGLAFTVGTSLVISLFLYKWVELPSIRLGKRVTDWTLAHLIPEL